MMLLISVHYHSVVTYRRKVKFLNNYRYFILVILYGDSSVAAFTENLLA